MTVEQCWRSVQSKASFFFCCCCFFELNANVWLGSSSGAGRFRSKDKPFLGFFDNSSDSRFSNEAGLGERNDNVVFVDTGPPRCRLMWPPKACPDVNFAPQYEHS